MAQKSKTHRQMSESISTIAFLTMSGGLQDAYSYCARGKVFANAQTGNLVLMSAHFFEGQWLAGIRYLIPLLSFACGVFSAELVRKHFQTLQTVHWRQLTICIEILLLLLVGFMPERMNPLANAITSFACAIQVQTFRKLNGRPFASTMCIGNIRSGTEALYACLHTKNRQDLQAAREYFGVIGLFALGAGIGARLTSLLGSCAIWGCCGLLLVSFLLMFIPET